MLDIILIVIGMCYLLVGSVTDIRTMEVPDWLNFSLIGVGVSMRIIGSLVLQDVSVLVDGVLGLVIFGGIAFALYYSGQWGGGDAKLLIGLGALIGFEFSLDTFMVRFLIYMLVAGACYGFVWSIVMAVKKRRQFTTRLRSIIKKQKNFRRILFSVVVLSLIASFFVGVSMRIILLSFTCLTLLTYYLLLFVRAIEESAMHKRVTPDQLTEGDWIVHDVVVDNKRMCGPKDLGIERNQINALKKLAKENKVRTVLIKQGIPFVPSFLIGFILALILPSPFLLVV